MKKKSWPANLFTGHNLIRVLLLVIGFTVFPALVYWGQELLFPSSQALSGFYNRLYGSVMDWGMDGMFAWCVFCTPYLAFDIYLIVKDLWSERLEAGQQ